MDSYRFYGWEGANVSPTSDAYPEIRNPRDMYDALAKLWSRETCAPRLAEKWSEHNRTLGQCSITAFLVQDVFGGEVWGIRRPDGNCHCYNVVDDCVFDLTSEQFGDEILDYSLNVNSVQSREKHFSQDRKKERYEALRDAFVAKYRKR